MTGAASGKPPMSPERWRRIEDLFYQALEIEVAERADFLDRACAGDDELRDEVSALLGAGDQSADIHGLLAEQAGRAASSLDGRPERFGPYRVLRELGRGGLGTVFLAERDDEHFSMQVAIKWVRRGLDTDDILRRLRRERQILAHLDHPHITRLLDGGSSPDGRPYLVMEYVDGSSLDTYADRLRLDVRQRLELMLDVCSAVAQAHRNLIIHRDIKPSNLMVTADGTVKLLDFGIAQLLDRDNDSEATLPEQRLLTPGYASPEQLRGKPLSTATDIYSLGATLYLLLTGAPPFDTRDLTAPDATPMPPSERILMQDAPIEIADRRRSVPARLFRRLRGDLDNIVAKAMAVDSQHRYGSVAELAEDLRRHLTSRPVRARPAAWITRCRKFVRRHRFGVLAAGLVLTSLLGGLWATSWQAQRAQRAQARAERVSSFLERLLEASKPEVAMGREVSVRSVLDRESEQMVQELADEPEVQARLLSTMGRAYSSLGIYGQSVELHRRALELRRRLHGEHHLEVAAGAAALAEPLIELEELDRAAGHLKEALRIREEELGSEDIAVGQTLADLGKLERLRRNPKAAEGHLLRALDIYRRVHGHPEGTARALHRLGALYLRGGRFARAEKVLRETVSIRMERLGEDHPESLTSMANLARVLRLDGKHDEAEQLLRRALTAGRHVWGDTHPYIANTLTSLGKVTADAGRAEEAVTLYEQALEVATVALGGQHRSIGRFAANLGEAQLLAGSPADAEASFSQSVRVHEDLPEHPELARSLELLGRLRCELDPSPDAAGILQRAVEVRRRVHPPRSSDFWRIAAAQGSWGVCLRRLDDSAAEPVLHRAREALIERFGPRSARVRALADPP